jgi:hypothetical protein
VVQVGGNRLNAEFDRMLVASTPDLPVISTANVATRLLMSLTDDELHELADFLDG